MDNGKVRNEMNTHGMDVVLIIRPDEKKMYSVMLAQKMVMEMPLDPEKMKAKLPPTSGDDGKFELVGPDTVDGAACTKYKVTSSKDNKVFFWWVNDATKAPVKMTVGGRLHSSPSGRITRRARRMPRHLGAASRISSHEHAGHAGWRGTIGRDHERTLSSSGHWSWVVAPCSAQSSFGHRTWTLLFDPHLQYSDVHFRHRSMSMKMQELYCDNGKVRLEMRLREDGSRWRPSSGLIRRSFTICCLTRKSRWSCPTSRIEFKNQDFRRLGRARPIPVGRA